MSRGPIRYGFDWNGHDDLMIELEMIRRKGVARNSKGIDCGLGLGLFAHYMLARKLCWPDRYRHRWTDLMYQNFITKRVIILLGSGSSQKTSHASEFALLTYFLHPESTLVIVSTTSTEKLEMAIFGEIKKLWQEARDRFPWLPGNVIDHKHAIATDSVESGRARDMRKGIKGLSCYVGQSMGPGSWVGLGNYAGIKQKRLLFIGDELQFMQPTFLDALPNMMQNGDLTVIGSGNPKHDPLDCLGRAAEPKGGWDSLPKVEKTTVWETNFEDGVCLNLVGTDSPNFDFNEDCHYPGLINRRTIRAVAHKWGLDSLEYSRQCQGIMRIGMIGNRVITELLCKQHKAFEPAKWSGSNRTRIYACDPAWGGVNADRCVAGWGEFGEADDGQQILCLHPPVIVPIAAGINVLPDDQIALFIQADIKKLNIKPEDVFYDSTGRGTVGPAFARIFGFSVPVPISFGDRPSSRPVRHDLWKDEPGGKRRLMRCDEYYSKFVSELWFSARYVIECDQMRELPREVMYEGTMREYTHVAGDKIEVEKKEITQERMGCSPDLFDWAALIVEGARQRGFKIQRLGVADETADPDEDFFATEEHEWEDSLKSRLLHHGNR